MRRRQAQRTGVRASGHGPARARARRAAAALPALLALALLAGCGSSQSPTGSTAAAGTTVPGAAASSTGTSTSGSSLKVARPPRFATPSKSEPVRSGTVQIAYRNITVRPVTLRVRAGTTVRWTNFDPVAHNVTSEGGPQRFASHDFGEGGSFEVKLARPGIVHFECTIHPATMNGAIEVL